MARPAEYDWIALEREYHCSGLSYKQLAEKHGIPISTLKQAAAKQKWSSRKPGKPTGKKLRELNREVDDVALVPAGETVPEIPYHEKSSEIRYVNVKSKEARKAYFLELTDAMARRIEDAIQKVDTSNAYAIKLLTGALVDLQQMQGIKTELDIEEQEARIAKLKMEANIVEEQQGVVVEFVDTEGAEN